MPQFLYGALCPYCRFSTPLLETTLAEMIRNRQVATTGEPFLVFVCQRCTRCFPWNYGMRQALSQYDALSRADPVWISIVAECESRDCKGQTDPDGERVRVPSPRLLRAIVELARLGIPLEDLFSELRQLRSDVDAIAGRFVQMVVHHVIEPHLVDGVPSARNAENLADIVLRMRPLATTVVTAELDLALQQTADMEFGIRLEGMPAQPSPSVSDRES